MNISRTAAASAFELPVLARIAGERFENATAIAPVTNAPLSHRRAIFTGSTAAIALTALRVDAGALALPAINQSRSRTHRARDPEPGVVSFQVTKVESLLRAAITGFLDRCKT